jgi:hypothetical protein
VLGDEALHGVRAEPATAPGREQNVVIAALALG